MMSRDRATSARATRRLTREEEAWIRAEAPDFPARGLALRFGRRFGRPISPGTIISACRRLGVRTRYGGLLGAERPWTVAPSRLRPIGAERVHWRTGEILVRIALPVRQQRNARGVIISSWWWRLRRIETWEAAHGPLPEGWAVMRLVDDPTDDRIDVLIGVPKGVLCSVNRRGGLRAIVREDDPDRRRAAVLAIWVRGRVRGWAPPP